MYDKFNLDYFQTLIFFFFYVFTDSLQIFETFISTDEISSVLLT